MLLERLHLLSADIEWVNVIGINIHMQQRRNKTLHRDEELFSLIGNSYEGSRDYERSSPSCYHPLKAAEAVTSAATGAVMSGLQTPSENHIRRKVDGEGCEVDIV